MLVFGVLACVAGLVGMILWPDGAAEVIEHRHDDLPEDHPHLLKTGIRTGAHSHRHRFVIDDEHQVWPTHG